METESKPSQSRVMTNTTEDWCSRTATCLKQLRLLPRVVVITWFAFTIYVGVWFMKLPDPTTVQMTYASGVMAALATILGFYNGSVSIGKNSSNKGND